MNKRFLLIVTAFLPLWSACYDYNANCDTATQKEYMGRCYNINDCVPGCDAETQKCVHGECIEKNICNPECDEDTPKCYQGKCIDKNACAPACDESERCIKGACLAQDACLEECDTSYQKCYYGKCVDKSSCAPACDKDTQKCIEGTCYDKNQCVPECIENYQKCVNGKCVSIDSCYPACDEETEKCYKGECIDKTICMPECDEESQKCADGKCIDISECYPACENDQICVEGSCETPDPNLCDGKYCKDDLTYCDDTGHWKKCDVGFGCHIGYCIRGLGPECETGTCNEELTKACEGGAWVDCGSMESCVAGQCKIKEDTCEPNSCSEDDHYRCNAEGHYEACPIGSTCANGICNKNEPDATTDESCNGFDDDCDGKIDEDYQPTAVTFTDKLGICCYGIKVCENGSEVEKQLFNPRKYDFYGDGIDSSCDGEDWDVAGAIYIKPLGDGPKDGNDDHSGTKDSPIATIQKALWNGSKEGLARMTDTAATANRGRMAL